jgi:predicted nucleic acid-binding protein
MGPSVYIETSIVSVLTARASREIVQAARQRMTQDWWAKRSKFSLFISNLVLAEATAGDPKASERRLSTLEGIPELTVSTNAIDLAEALVRGGGLPPKAAVDAFHIAIAAAHGIDYLLTWNCKHIANATMRGTIENICRDQGVVPPVICTPDQLPPRTSK